jgi:HEAT repeat protein
VALFCWYHDSHGKTVQVSQVFLEPCQLGEDKERTEATEGVTSMMRKSCGSFVIGAIWVFVVMGNACGAVHAGAGIGREPKDVILRLAEPDAKVREQACNDLRAMGDRATDAMIEGLRSPNNNIRYQVASLLGSAKNEKATGPLIKLAQSEEGLDRYYALQALGQIGGPEVATVFIAALQRAYPKGGEDYCRILGAIGDNRAIEPLIRVLLSTEGEESRRGEGLFRVRTREAAAEALGKFRDPRARAALVKAVAEDPDWAVYHVARQALYRMDDQTLYPEYGDYRAAVVLSVAKEPEPLEGAKEFLRKWQQDHPNGQGSWIGPILENYASGVDIERARDKVVQLGRDCDPNLIAGGVTEILMEYLCGRKLRIEPANAKALLIRIGKPAVPALQNGADRANGDIALVRNCLDCIGAIKAAERTAIKPGETPGAP